jgi:uncharacterized protein (TIGR03663 family)
MQTIISTEQQPTPSSWLDKPVFRSLPAFRIETLIVIIILVLAVFSRFYILGNRVMSHDEVNHVVPSWELFKGQGYRHDPITHGPVQFHLVALSYFLFGDNDFTSRVPAALFSIATIGFVLFAFRRYLGRIGALIAGFLFLISPYMLFYGRYTRNEVFVALYGVVTLYTVLRYLEKGENWSLYVLTAVTALHFATKETSYIYTAQLLLFLAFLFMVRVARGQWSEEKPRNGFILLLAGAMFFLIVTIGLAAYNAVAAKPVAEGETAAPVPAEMLPTQTAEMITILAALVLGVWAIILLLHFFGWEKLKQERSFDLLVLIGTLILPQLTAFPVKMIGKFLGLGWNPQDYTTPGLLRTGSFLIVITAIAIFIGLMWKPRLWLINAALFYGIFTVFYTTFFTNGLGFFTGIVGSLGYWLDQQSVQRGTQPWYFYALIQIPVYEYLAAFGAMIAVYFGLAHHRLSNPPGERLAVEEADIREIGLEPEGSEAEIEPSDPVSLVQEPDSESQPLAAPAQPLPVLILLIFWSITSLVAYSLAGEKMPWLTVHIALPLLLAAGWGFGYLFETMPWHKLKENKAWLSLILLPVFLASLFGALAGLLGDNPPFQGNTIDQLRATSNFIFSVAAVILSGWGISRSLSEWDFHETLRLVTAAVFAVMAVLTVRVAVTSSFINYDTAKEFLVYAHAASGPKEVLKQVEEISRRTTGGKNIQVAYTDDALYPYWWYFRDYPNKRWVSDNPTRDLRDFALIVAGDQNLRELDSITKGNFVSFDYKRLWWPMQDYYYLTWERIWNTIRDRKLRAAVFDIWLNRDYTKYVEVKNNPSLTPETWSPSENLRFYVRKDIVAKIWNYGAAPEIPIVEEKDPYEAGMISLPADQVIGGPGNLPGQFQAPRGIAFAPDGSLYVADSRNHRIQHYSADGQLLHSWGSFADAAQGAAPGGTFYEPWGIAVASDGSVFVADTWNHRIQKFTADGQFITTWGYFGQAEAPEAFWGPRDIALDAKGRLYVTDTGNKRIVIFDQNGNYIAQFGKAGFDPGEFDEQVGLAITAEGEIYITDTWNQRIQVFTFDETTLQGIYLRSWEVAAWSGQSIENKPYIAVDARGHVFITEPENFRVLEFTGTGEFVRGWGGYSPSSDGFSLPSGIEVDADGHVWVSDAGNNTVLRFTLPEEVLPATQ